VVLGLVAGAPVVAVAVHAIAAGWVPDGDRADYAVRAYDVFSDRAPLLGPWSSGATAAVGQVGQIVYSPGPMLFWLIAVPARLVGGSSLHVTGGLVNLVSIIAMLGLANRRGGRPLMFATALAVPLMLNSLPPETRSDFWNSSAPLLPFAVLVFLCWSLACGDYRLLPAVVLVASFAAQSHLTFVVPTLGVLTVGLVGLALSRPSRRGERIRPWLIAAVVIGLVCWSPALIDEVTNRPGNLSLLVDAVNTSEPTLGARAGWHATVEMVGIPPWWLKGPREPLGRIVDLTRGPGTATIASAALICVALAGAALLGWRRRRADLCAAGVLGLVLCAAVAIDSASTPRSTLVTVQYTLRWTSPAGMCVWLLLGWSLAVLSRRSLPWPRVATVSGLVAVVVVAGAVALGTSFERHPYDQQRAIADRLLEELPDSGATRLDGSSLEAVSFRSGAVYALRRGGKDVVVAGAGPALGPDYDPGRGYRRVVTIDVAPSPAAPAPGARRLARLTYRAQDGAPRTVTVDLTPAR
jgi:hypothetical protein